MFKMFKANILDIYPYHSQSPKILLKICKKLKRIETMIGRRKLLNISWIITYYVCISKYFGMPQAPETKWGSGKVSTWEKVAPRKMGARKVGDGKWLLKNEKFSGI